LTPNLDTERELWSQGHSLVAGLDEAGRGAWAGPVVAAAVILPRDHPGLMQALRGVRDSKALTPEERARWLPRIRRVALAVGVGMVPPWDIDTLGIVPATRLAMLRALDNLRLRPQALVVDGLKLPDCLLPQICFYRADVRCMSVAAASVVAKVARDELMIGLEQRYPGYHFARHKGYGTPQHRAALESLGPTPIHRWTFAPVQALLGASG